MTDTTISDALVFPQDVGTGTPEDEEDYSSAGYFSLLSKYKGEGSYVGEDTSGNPTLQFNDVDTTNEQVDVGTGYAYIMDSMSVQSGFQTVYDVALPNNSPYVVMLPNEVTNLDLGTDTDNDIWLAVDPSSNDGVYIRHGSGLSAPTDPSVKLGTVNTSDGSTTRTNDLGVATFDTLSSNSVSTGEADITNETFIRATRSSDSATTSSGTTINVFDGESKDVRGEFSNTQFTPDNDGEYFIVANIRFDGGNTVKGDALSTQIRDVDAASKVVVNQQQATGNNTVHAFPFVVSLSANTTYEIQTTNFDSSFVVNTIDTKGEIVKSVVA